MQHTLALIRVLPPYSGRYAGVEVTVQNEGAHLLESSLDGEDLVDDIHAVCPFLDHPRDPPDVPLDAPEASNDVLCRGVGRVSMRPFEGDRRSDSFVQFSGSV